MNGDRTWQIAAGFSGTGDPSVSEILRLLLANRGLTQRKDISEFLKPADPFSVKAADTGIDAGQIHRAVGRILTAVKDGESVVVYADYDADGVCAGTVMWETLHKLGCRVMPYIPHRVDEGYGLSEKGIDAVRKDHGASLIITVDHGITAYEKVEYAKRLGIDVIVTDHHVPPDRLPDTTVVHTTNMCGAGVAWFLSKAVSEKLGKGKETLRDLLAVAAIGTIADMVPLVSVNRSLAKFGLAELNRTTRVGLNALIAEAGLVQGTIGTYEISHVLAPRLNAVGRLVHAIDAMRLLCTNDPRKAAQLAEKLGTTNRERQQLTSDTTIHAARGVTDAMTKKLLFVSHESYNQGVIGLVAGKLVEEFYRPAVVVSVGERVSKASARSIAGFNIVEAIRSVSDLLLEVGGHPMAAGFSVETKNLDALRQRLEKLAEERITEDHLKRILPIDCRIPLSQATQELWLKLQEFEPFGFGNPSPVFMSEGIRVLDIRKVGTDGRHLKLKVTDNAGLPVDAIAFGMGDSYAEVTSGGTFDIAYMLDMNFWNGNSKLQLKVRDIRKSVE